MRWVSCSLPISKENTAQTLFCVVAMFSTMFMANEVFPIAGRAASSTRSVSCNPLVSRSNCLNPVCNP